MGAAADAEDHLTERGGFVNLTILPQKLQGTLKIPSSKSVGHRMVIGAALAGGGKVENLTLSADIQATLEGIKALGADCCLEDGTAIVYGRRQVIEETVVLDCNESGSTLRFLMPVAVALCPEKKLIFKGKGRLLERPLEPYFQFFDQMGIRYSREKDSLIVQGTLTSGICKLSGKISSQFITGLLYALPLLEGESKIVITDTLESRGYVDMTLEVLRAFGVSVVNKDYGEFVIPGGQGYRARNAVVEGDYSQAAFFYAANFIGSSVLLEGLNHDSSQGDRVVENILKDFAEKGDYELDVSDIPDLVPALAAAAAYRVGKETRFVNGSRLRMKESDRIASTCSMLRSLGAYAEEGEDSITIRGQESLSGTGKRSVDCCNDHRIAMAAAAAAVGCIGKVQLLGAQCISKSYPAFWEDYRRLGGKIIEEDGR